MGVVEIEALAFDTLTLILTFSLEGRMNKTFCDSLHEGEGVINSET